MVLPDNECTELSVLKIWWGYSKGRVLESCCPLVDNTQLDRLSTSVMQQLYWITLGRLGKFSHFGYPSFRKKGMNGWMDG